MIGIVLKAVTSGEPGSRATFGLPADLPSLQGQTELLEETQRGQLSFLWGGWDSGNSLSPQDELAGLRGKQLRIRIPVIPVTG